ncbi:DUF6722 family protein [Parabacteroides goldsteinii]|uniref:Uncharacterized protein n=1 Tax=Parabacteroides goldsteinii CL02T12C30 TaxID=999418 RepID=K5ZKX7_9BACT|nr:DUF6722 family protein [Parabacteroides goldsteinii]EKN11925.1 hypothetical protein HMPREF1076_03637 [Parabacteroides goldsteinii CL02T12C30]
MGKFIERKEAQKTSAEMKKLKKETMAKYFYDLSKLTFTAMVLGGIISFLQGTEIKWIIAIIAGSVLAIALAGIGNSLLK